MLSGADSSRSALTHRASAPSRAGRRDKTSFTVMSARSEAWLVSGFDAEHPARRDVNSTVRPSARRRGKPLHVMRQDSRPERDRSPVLQKLFMILFLKDAMELAWAGQPGGWRHHLPQTAG